MEPRGRGGNCGYNRNRGAHNQTYGRAMQIDKETSECASDEEYNHIEVRSKASKELIQDMQMEVGEEQQLHAPSFSQHIVQKKKSIHVPVSIQGVKATALIDCGATDNFINHAFLKKKGLVPQALSVHRDSKLGGGMTKVTQQYQGEMTMAGTCMPLSFFAMNGESSQGDTES